MFRRDDHDESLLFNLPSAQHPFPLFLDSRTWQVCDGAVTELERLGYLGSWAFLLHLLGMLRWPLKSPCFIFSLQCTQVPRADVEADHVCNQNEYASAVEVAGQNVFGATLK